LIADRCEEIISSSDWPLAPKGVVTEILKQDFLNVESEQLLLEALVEWGKGQDSFDSENEDSDYDQISDFLPLVRFKHLNSSQFVSLCEKERSLFSETEQLKVLKCLVTDDETFLPKEFGHNVNARQKVGQRAYVNFNYSVGEKYFENRIYDMLYSIFNVNRNLFLIGIRLYSLDFLNADRFLHIVCALTQENNPKVLATAEFKGVVQSGQKSPLKFRLPVFLSSDTQYKVTVKNQDTVEPSGNIVPREIARVSVPEEEISNNSSDYPVVVNLWKSYMIGDVYELIMEFIDD